MKPMSSVDIFPLGGFGIRTGKARINVYGYNRVWIINDASYMATLEDINGVVIQSEPLNLNFLLPDGTKSNSENTDPSYFEWMKNPPEAEVDIIRPGATKPFPTVTIRRGDIPTPVNISLQDNKPTESEEVITAIRKILAMK